MARFPCSFLLLLFQFLLTVNPSVCFDHEDEFSILDFDFHGDYTPPSPPEPPLPPLPPSLSCEEDLNGIGSLDTVCQLNSSLDFHEDVSIAGNGSLHVLPGVVLRCPVSGCLICVNVSKGEFSLGRNARIISGSVFVSAINASFLSGSLVNVSALAGEPPAQTTGTPSGWQGGGGGHGGRGASCLTDNTKSPDDVWGGDTYSWSSLEKPWSYGSKGGSTSKEEDYGGRGGGRVRVEVRGLVEVGGSLLANGGDGGMKGGGGSGGSVYIEAQRMTGNGKISATGGNGFAGGGGGRISINVFSRHDDTMFFAHGGSSFGCLGNAGAAGTYYDSFPRTLTVTNHNMSTDTDTILTEFPKRSPWTNVYLKDHAKAAVPLYWSRVQVQGQISLSCCALLSFGLAQYASSEFELMAEELLMSDSVIKIYGALRMAVKIHLMWNSKMLIDAGSDAIVDTSLVEASNLLVLKESSVIHSNSNLGVHGQGYLNLSGPGDVIEAQHLTLSLFFSIYVGSGSILRGPLKNASSEYKSMERYCELQDCPVELIHPPEDCNVNSSLAFTLQICRVEYVIVSGSITGSIVHFHWVRAVFVHASGAILTSGLGCTGGVGRGKTFDNGLGGGGGHGGKGGDGYYNGTLIEGGVAYGDADLPCELGSGSGNGSLAGATAGGGIIIMGSMEHSLSSLSINGSLRADGESFGEDISNSQSAPKMGPGGGSGGTILLFIGKLALGNSSSISSAGGHGSHYGGGGGGGGRVHFHWSDIPTGDEYLPVASVEGSIYTGGGFGRGQGHDGKSGTLTGKPCPKGLYGIYCQECPIGTFKNASGSDRALCYKCPSNELPRRGVYLYIRGGVTKNPCPYKCISDRYRMPKCYTALEELIDTFGGPWLFSFLLLAVLVLLALVLSVARLKYVGADELPARVPAHRNSRIDHSFPFLESLNEVLETNRIEETQSHVHRMYFMGPNTFTQPWHLVHSPPDQVTEIVYEDAFNRFVDEINNLATYQWWEGSIHSILSVVAYPLAWSWLQWRRQQKLQQLREFVRSEYDHACLRSCRSRALYEGLKVAATADLMLAYMDFFCGGDEKRNDLPARLCQRLPMCLLFGGDGNYMTPFSLESDTVLTSLMSQSVPPTTWYRFVAGLNAQLRLVSRAHLKITFSHVISWLETHANPALSSHGVRVDIAWSQPTSSGYCQFGLLVHALANETGEQSIEEHLLPSDESEVCKRDLGIYPNAGEDMLMRKRIYGGILHLNNLQTLKVKRGICCPPSFIVWNTKPVSHQDLVGLLISLLLLADFSLVLLILLQLYSISLLDFFLVLFILPLAILLPFPAGINALFGHGHKRSAALSRLYALWNITSLINIVTALICGFLHHRSHSSDNHPNFQAWNFSMDESEWWMLPCGLFLCKVIQIRLVDRHVANEEIQDHSLYSNDPDLFWQT